MRFWMTYLCLMFLSIYLFGQKSNFSFGSIKLQIDSGKDKELNINTAILYENADVEFDTTVQVQGGDDSRVLFYPQIVDGSHDILRLIMAPNDNENDFYDVIFNLGDSLGDRIVYEGADSMVFFNHKGRLNQFKNYTKNLEGRFLFLEGTSKKEKISGEMNATFQIPLQKDEARLSSISLKGTFDAYLGDFRAVSLATGPQSQKKKTRYMKNLVIAMIMASIGLFIFLGQ